MKTFENVQPIQKVKVRGESGAVVEIDFTELVADSEQKRIIVKMLSEEGGFDQLSDQEKEKIKDVKATVGGGAVPMLICRFDWTWFRID